MFVGCVMTHYIRNMCFMEFSVFVFYFLTKKKKRFKKAMQCQTVQMSLEQKTDATASFASCGFFIFKLT